MALRSLVLCPLPHQAAVPRAACNALLRGVICHTAAGRGLDEETPGAGHVSDVHFAILYVMLMLPAERERETIIPGLCPHCHADQVMKGGNTKVHM
jgi:hypothetical protein